MPKGSSGRIVVEVDPDLKRLLYSALAIENLTLKDWLIDAATSYVNERKLSLLPIIDTKNQRRAKKS